MRRPQAAYGELGKRPLAKKAERIRQALCVAVVAGWMTVLAYSVTSQ
ncbi:hypothetical protein [Streptomyces albipurpureus]|uniref:Uncharacterized protein n=1 Tax=Streptomyces albipurpureus TaxID=2897419 RepID=A0ABT0UWT2_9ACTN|nr:hypothetical protein [Streptomyces sp. CWNU-1]MCM2392911.1 hypothetical protein [Streptomyces sp. CWNU-1]